MKVTYSPRTGPAASGVLSMHAGTTHKAGKWVWRFEPTPKWEAKADEIYSMRQSAIVCRLWGTESEDLIPRCLAADFLPPRGWRRWRILARVSPTGS